MNNHRNEQYDGESQVQAKTVGVGISKNVKRQEQRQGPMGLDRDVLYAK
jgi:hypothetical protein